MPWNSLISSVITCRCQGAWRFLDWSSRVAWDSTLNWASTQERRICLARFGVLSPFSEMSRMLKKAQKRKDFILFPSYGRKNYKLCMLIVFPTIRESNLDDETPLHLRKYGFYGVGPTNSIKANFLRNLHSIGYFTVVF